MAMVGFVPEPNCGRGTVGIIWNCLVTIFLSTWTPTHCEVSPTAKETRQGRWAVTLLFVTLPEFGVATAMSDLIQSIQLSKSLRRINGWESWSLKQSFLIMSNGVQIKGTETVLKWQGLLDLARSRAITLSQFPSDDEIDARSKSDWVTKAIAIVQGAWFAANTASRLISGYPITLLEDMTAAYVVCGLAMSILWFRCPQDIQERFLIPLRGGGNPNEEYDVVSYKARRALRWTIIYTLMPVVMLFVGIHLAAWNYPFPTVTEAWMWRASVMLTLVLSGVIS